MEAMHDPDQRQYSHEFMLKEYEVLEGIRKDRLHLIEARLTVQISIVGGGLLALGALGQMDETMDKYPYLTPFISSMVIICLFSLA